jgi:hypothetical protein
MDELLLGLCSLAALSVSSLSLVSMSGGLLRVPATTRGSSSPFSRKFAAFCELPQIFVK